MSFATSCPFSLLRRAVATPRAFDSGLPAPIEIFSSVMVTVTNKFTRLANKCPDGQRHLLSVAALAASLGCKPGVSSFKHAAGTFSLALRDREKLTPPNIRNGLGQVAVPDQAFNVQVFDADAVETGDELGRLFVVKILARPTDLKVREGDLPAGLLPICPAFFLAAQAPLIAGQLLFRRSEVSGVRDRLARRERRETLDPDIDAYGSPRGRQGRRLVDPADEERVPPVGPAGHAKLLDCAFNGAAQTHAASADARHGQLITLKRAAPDGFVLLAESVVTLLALESREACAGTLEEGLKREVETLESITLNRSQTGLNLRNLTPRLSQLARLLVEIHTFACLLVGADPVFQGAVVDEAGRIKSLLAAGDKLLVGSQTILESLCDKVRVSHSVCAPVANGLVRVGTDVSASPRPAPYSTTKQPARLKTFTGALGPPADAIRPGGSLRLTG